MIKKDVQLFGVRPEMNFAHIEIKAIFAKHGIECVVTSGIGKKHKKRSFHPIGFALDYRTKHIESTLFGKTRKQKIQLLLNELKSKVPQCDFIFEHEGQLQEHIHSEFDPKNDARFQHYKELYLKSGHWSS